MQIKDMYEKSWAHQRLREGSIPDKADNFFSREKFSTSRYDLAQNQVLKYINGRPIRNYADVGCGRGEMICRLGPMADSVIGLDVSDCELSILHSSLPDGVKLRTKLHGADLNSQWPLDNNSVDLITCLATMEHLFDPYFFVKEIDRVTRDNALVVIEVPNIAFIGYRLSLLLGRFPSTSGDPIGWDGGHLHYFTIHDLRNLFETSGFEIKEVKTGGFLSGLRSIWPAGFGRDISVVMVKNL